VLAVMPYPTLHRLGTAFRGVPDERESAETVGELQGRGSAAAAQAQTATSRPWWRRMFGG
jgi:hypothetical protein